MTMATVCTSISRGRGEIGGGSFVARLRQARDEPGLALWKKKGDGCSNYGGLVFGSIDFCDFSLWQFWEFILCMVFFYKFSCWLI